MKLLKTITDKDFGRSETPEKWATYRVRPSARAILYDNQSRIALMHVTSDNYYKLPGGGIDEGEDTPTALARELLEEVGASSIEIISEIGRVDDFRDGIGIKSEHTCYVARLTGEIIEPARTEEEISEGYETVWVKNIDIAIKTVESGRPLQYGHDFERLRELTFLIEVKPTF